MYGQDDEISIELSLEDVKKVALHYGFKLEKEKIIETTYTTNPRSMMQVSSLHGGPGNYPHSQHLLA
uniref:Carnosine N-methyltransferase-like n=1 Tax=Rhizophora mucronata TaxID=61149 RepID=A0A2P2K6Z5_RHIMU